MMIAQTPRQQNRSRLNPFRVMTNQTHRRPHATLIVDGLGRICGCGEAVEDILGASRSRLIGKKLSVFFADLFREEGSPSYNARYLAHLGAHREWQKFEATDARGSGFVVEIKVSRRLVDSGEVFVLDLRRPDNTT